MLEAEYQKIGRHIRMMRMSKGMQQREFADLLGISQTSLSAMEHGKVPTTLKRLFQMRDVLGCAMRDFFDEEEERPAGDDVSVEEVVEAMRIVKQMKSAKARSL